MNTIPTSQYNPKIDYLVCKNAKYPNLKIGKLGYKGLINEFYNQAGYDTLKNIISGTFNFIYDIFL